MKKIIVKVSITPPVPRKKHVSIETSLTGVELVAYKTNAGTICLLHKLSRETQSYGFLNMAYGGRDNSGGPVFVSDTWYGSIKAAGEGRELVAFDNYVDLLQWIVGDVKDRKEAEFQKTPFVLGQMVLVADQPGSVWLRRWFRKRTVHGLFEVYTSSNMYDGTSFWNMCIPYDERLEGTIVR